MASRAATLKAQKEVRAVSAKSTPKQKAQAKIYRSRGASSSKYHRITMFVEEGEYGFNGQYLEDYLQDMGQDYAVRDYVVVDVEISREDFQLAFGG